MVTWSTAHTVLDAGMGYVIFAHSETVFISVILFTFWTAISSFVRCLASDVWALISTRQQAGRRHAPTGQDPVARAVTEVVHAAEDVIQVRHNPIAAVMRVRQLVNTLDVNRWRGQPQFDDIVPNREEQRVRPAAAAVAASSGVDDSQEESPLPVCPICHEAMGSSGPPLVCGTVCTHAFHRPCLSAWSAMQRDGPMPCPVCRRPTSM